MESDSSLPPLNSRCDGRWYGYGIRQEEQNQWSPHHQVAKLRGGTILSANAEAEALVFLHVF